jgi:2'-5' RNA ligase
MKTKRRQLTLFVNKNDSIEIEEVRKKYNLIQFQIIAAHVTLCREDELLNLKQVIENLEKNDFNKLQMSFEKAIRSSNQKGVLLPAKGFESFQNLRKNVLNGSIKVPKNLNPHITLLHPRNASLTDEIFNEISEYKFPQKINFSKVSLIEQEIDSKWEILREFDLK